MNEKLVFRFIQNGHPLPIEELAPVEFDRGGVVLDGETSAWPRGLRFDFEGVGPDWLRDDAPRPKRKACLLNILGRLRVAQAMNAPLINFVQEIFFADVDRIYAKVDLELFNRLRELDRDSGKPFSLDRGPLDPVHHKLLRRIPRDDQDATEQYRKAAASFRRTCNPASRL